MTTIKRVLFLLLPVIWGFAPVFGQPVDNWSSQFNLPGTNNLVTALASDGDRVYATGLFNNINGAWYSYKLASYDGMAWTAFPDSVNGPDYPQEIKVRNGVIWVADINGLYKYDGNWTQVGNSGNLPVYDFDFDTSGNIYITGAFTSMNGISANGVARYDGISWSSLGSGLNVSAGNVARAIHCAGGFVYIAGPFNAVGGINSTGFACWNGSSWSGLNTGGMILGLSTDICTFNGDLYVSALASPTGFNGMVKVFRYLSGSLQQIGGNFNSDIYHLRIINNTLTAAGNFTQVGSTGVDYIAQWDGIDWVNAGQGLNFVVYDIAEANGFTFAAGDVSMPGSPVNFRHTAVRKNNCWKPTGNGMNGSVEALYTYGSTVFAGGRFSEAGGLAGKIVRWNGSQWDTLSGGMVINKVYDLVVFRDTLYAGGEFTNPSDLSGHYIIRWNGSTWEPVPGSVNYTVFTLESYNNELYVGGDFSSTPSGPAYNIVKYDGQSWIPISSLTNGIVKDIAFDQNGLMYVGGGFTTIGGVQARRIAKYNGVTWSEVGSGVDQFVNAIGISPNNEVYIGGQFYLGYNVGILNHIAKFNGVALQPVSGGIGSFSDNIYDIRFLCGKLLVTGVFRLNGTDTLNHIATYDAVNGWEALDLGLRQDLTAPTNGLALTIQNNRLWVGGNFSFAGPFRSNGIGTYSAEGIPALRIENLDGSACVGDTVRLVLRGKNLGVSPQYYWRLNSTAVGANDTILYLYPVNNGDTITAGVVINPQCGSPDSIVSESYIIQTSSMSQPVVSQSGNTLSVINPETWTEYRWQQNAGSIWNDLGSSAIGNVFIASAPGQYRVRAAKGSCIRFSALSQLTPVDEILNRIAEPTIFPNPVNGILTLKQADGYDQLELLDISGRVLFRKTIPADSMLTFDMGAHPAGAYFLRISGGQKPVFTLKVLKL